MNALGVVLLNRRVAFAVLIAIAGVALAGCEANRQVSNSIAGMRQAFDLPPPTPSDFVVCRDHACRVKVRVSLGEAEWGQVRSLMSSTPPSDAAEERARIARATALLEDLVAAQAGTGGDVGGTFSGLGRGAGQLDCEDEAANTTQYLVMMDEDGLLRFHAPIGRQWRGNFVNGWPHTTAVIVETASGREWAVDTWFEDNGQPAHIVEVELWRAGWSPADKVGPQYGRR